MKHRLHLHFLDVGAAPLAQLACDQVRKLANGLVEAESGPMRNCFESRSQQGSMHQADIVILLYRAGEQRRAVHLPSHAGCVTWVLPSTEMDASIDIQARALMRELGIAVRAAPVTRSRTTLPADMVKRINNVATDTLCKAGLSSTLHAQGVA